MSMSISLYNIYNIYIYTYIYIYIYISRGAVASPPIIGPLYVLKSFYLKCKSFYFSLG